MNWTLALFAHFALMAGEGDSYANAHKVTAETGKPLMVMVSTDWCVPCQQMKKAVLPQVREHGVLGRVAFASVNADREQELAQKLTGGGPVPQLVIYRKTRLGWVRRRLVGGQNVETVEKFINEAVAQTESDKGAEEADLPEATTGKLGDESASAADLLPAVQPIRAH
jgi:thioredoxin-like negative regulator of GroEL